MYWFFLSDFNKLEFSQHIFEKYSNIKLHENPSSESKAVVGGRTNRQTEKIKQTVIFSISHTPKSLIKL